MTTQEHSYTLDKDFLRVTAARNPDGLDLQVFRRDTERGDATESARAVPTPIARALARTAGGDVKLLFVDDPNGRHTPPQRAVEALAYFGATLGISPEGEIHGSNVVLDVEDTLAQSALESIGFPKADRVEASEAAMPIGDICLDLGATFPANFTGAHLPEAIRPELVSAGASATAA